VQEDGAFIKTEGDSLFAAVDGARVDKPEQTTTLQQPRHLPGGAAQAANIGQQMAAAARQGPGGTIELRLHPEELGRLRVHFDSTDQMLVISITAERPETADLMRRHIDQLAREMQSLGYRDVSFRFAGDPGFSSFGTGSGSADSGGSGNGSGPAMHSAGSAVDPTASPPIQNAHALPGAGLDLRI
jgi:hypothetical protein